MSGFYPQKRSAKFSFPQIQFGDFENNYFLRLTGNG